MSSTETQTVSRSNRSTCTTAVCRRSADLVRRFTRASVIHLPKGFRRSRAGHAPGTAQLMRLQRPNPSADKIRHSRPRAQPYVTDSSSNFRRLPFYFYYFFFLSLHFPLYHLNDTAPPDHHSIRRRRHYPLRFSPV